MVCDKSRLPTDNRLVHSPLGVTRTALQRQGFKDFDRYCSTVFVHLFLKDLPSMLVTLRLNRADIVSYVPLLL